MRGDVYARTHRSDGIAELKKQVDALQVKMGAIPQLDSIMTILDEMQHTAKSEREQLAETLAEVRRIMSMPLKDSAVLVECLEAMQQLARLHRESTEAILARLERGLDRKRQRLSLDPEPGETRLASTAPKNQ